MPGEVKSVVFSGKAPVDSHCTIKDKTHVFTEGNDIWDVMLNQVNNSVLFSKDQEVMYLPTSSFSDIIKCRLFNFGFIPRVNVC